MKTVPLTDLCANPNAVLDSAQQERVLISRAGKPSAVLVGVEAYDAEDLRWATSPEFWSMIRQRRSRGREIPLADLESRYGVPAPKRRSRSGRKARRK